MPNNDKQRDQGNQGQKREGQGPGQQGGFNNPSKGAGGTQQEHQQKDRGQKQNPGTTQSGGRSGMGHDDDEM